MNRQVLILASILFGKLLAEPTILHDKANSIAVIEFIAYGVSETEAAILTDRLRSELFKLGRFTVLERDIMTAILSEQDFNLQNCESDECMVEIGQLLGANLIVGGSVSKVGSTYSISARLIDMTSGRVTRTADYDHKGELEGMLTTAIPYIAEQLGSETAQRTDITKIGRRLDYRWTLSLSGGSSSPNEDRYYDQGALILSSFRTNPVTIMGRVFPVQRAIMLGGGTWYDSTENYGHNVGAYLLGLVYTQRWKQIEFEVIPLVGPGAVYYTRGTVESDVVIETDEGFGVSLFFSLCMQISYGSFPLVGEMRITNDLVYRQPIIGMGVGYRW